MGKQNKQQTGEGAPTQGGMHGELGGEKPPRCRRRRTEVAIENVRAHASANACLLGDYRRRDDFGSHFESCLERFAQHVVPRRLAGVLFSDVGGLLHDMAAAWTMPSLLANPINVPLRQTASVCRSSSSVIRPEI